jgi:hypothetical protein
MKTVNYRGANFELAEDGEPRAYFVLGVRKSGSTILNRIVKVLAKFNGKNFVNLPDAMFANGIIVATWQKDPEIQKLIEPGNVYGGFRTCPVSLLKMPVFRRARKILMVRDPRDALVSEYFSSAYSHKVPTSGTAREAILQNRSSALAMTIEEYVLKQAAHLKRTIREYSPLRSDGNLLTIRYEDRILDKRRLIDEICQYFEWKVREPQVQGILSWADVVPETEKPTEFVRKVTPGDHREKLSPQVIKQLNGIFAEEMALYGYG